MAGNEKSTTEDNSSSGFIPQGYYHFFLGGVLFGGTIVVPILVMIVGKLSAVEAFSGGIASAIVFIFCFDRHGNWQWRTAIPAIAFAGVVAAIHQIHTGQQIVVLGGVFGLIVYIAFGYMGVAFGKLVLKSAASGSSTATKKITMILIHIIIIIVVGTLLLMAF